jgi:hypothetical protein
VISAITRATGTTSESPKQYSSNIPGKHEVKELKKSRIGHCIHTADSANVKVQTYFTGEVTLRVAQI